MTCNFDTFRRFKFFRCNILQLFDKRHKWLWQRPNNDWRERRVKRKRILFRNIQRLTSYRSIERLTLSSKILERLWNDSKEKAKQKLFKKLSHLTTLIQITQTKSSLEEVKDLCFDLVFRVWCHPPPSFSSSRHFFSVCSNWRRQSRRCRERYGKIRA